MNNLNEGMLSFFDIFSEDNDIKEFNEEQEKIKSETTNANKKGEKKTDKKTDNKEKNESKVSEDKKEPKKEKVDPIKKIEEDCSKCEKVHVKVFGYPVFVLEEEEEIKSIKLENILKRLIECGFEKFSSIKVEWNLSLSEDKKIGELIPTYADFFAKG